MWQAMFDYIDFLNFACDFDPNSVGTHFADMGVDKVSDYLINCVTDENARLQRKDNVWCNLISGDCKEIKPQYSSVRVS
jgi:hypothetical protein